MLYARVQSLKFREFIESLIPVIRDERFQLSLDIHDVYQVAVLVQLGPFQLHLYAIMVRMSLIFRSPVPTEKEMLCHKVPLDCH